MTRTSDEKTSHPRTSREGESRRGAPHRKTYELPEAATALWLADRAAEKGDTAFLVRGVARLERLARAAAGFCAGRAELLVIPPWDVLPYDHAAPSASAGGRRAEALARLAEPGAGARGKRPRLVLVSAGAALLRVPPPGTWRDARTFLRPGDALDARALGERLRAGGYHMGETVSDPGDAAVHERVLDIFPAGGGAPARLTFGEGKIAAIHALDPLTQRRGAELPGLEVFPARELTLEGGELPEGGLVPVFDYFGGFASFVDEGVEARWAELREQVADAYAARRRRDPGAVPPPDALYLSEAEAASVLAAGRSARPSGTAEPTPRSVAELLARVEAADTPVVVAADVDPARLARSLNKRGVPARAAVNWPDAVSGGVACWRVAVDGGFRTAGILVLAAGHLLRQEAAAGGAGRLGGEGALRIGDVVVHAEHGTARLAGLRRVEVEGGNAERLALAFANEKELLVEPLELDRIWRYGAEGAVDHVHGDAWRARKAAIEAEIGAVAVGLAAAAARRAALSAPVLVPDRARFERLALRFPHPLSPDQRAAADAVMADLRRGTPMNRLLCGDVGFGKTEVALRALAAAALCGFQAALVAPTTVLARQHLETVRRRFAGTGVRVEPLFGSADKGAIRAGLADGSIGIVVGTQSLAAEGLDFAKLGLVVIDEEQRLGEAQKTVLVGREGAHGAVHSLVMTATPIPRTLQAAIVGLREVSVIATPPVNRQPTRTVVQPFDPRTLRDALLREKARGGQGFVVCPRIADLGPVAALLAELAPALEVVVAHGRLSTEALEEAVVGFAGGRGDVLLATDIIEAGLDVPRANTIAVLHPDRFGLAQLHQIRGRVGRGARRGTALLMTDPDRALPEATAARLRALEAASHLGAGIVISAADLDHRGAGELFGGAQAGHVSALGTELYHDLLLRALGSLRGEPARPPPPALHVGVHGRIPESYVHDAEVRVALYRRVARFGLVDEVDHFAEELADRFGPPPAEAEALLALARLRCVGAAAGIRHLEAGPRGISIGLHDGEAPGGLALRLSVLAERLGGTVRADRLVVPMPPAPPQRRVDELIALFAGGDEGRRGGT